MREAPYNKYPYPLKIHYNLYHKNFLKKTKNLLKDEGGIFLLLKGYKFKKDGRQKIL